MRRTRLPFGYLFCASLMFASALRRAGVPCEMHLFEQGPHGFLVAEGETRRILDTWWDHCADWLRLHGFAAPVRR